MDQTVCDKCHGSIVYGKCPCGIWLDTKDIPNFSRMILTIIYGYDYLYDQDIMGPAFSTDHFTGNCIVLFRGDYDLCMKVRDFIDKEQEKLGI